MKLLSLPIAVFNRFEWDKSLGEFWEDFSDLGYDWFAAGDVHFGVPRQKRPQEGCSRIQSDPGANKKCDLVGHKTSLGTGVREGRRTQSAFPTSGRDTAGHAHFQGTPVSLRVYRGVMRPRFGVRYGQLDRDGSNHSAVSAARRRVMSRGTYAGDLGLGILSSTPTEQDGRLTGSEVDLLGPAPQAQRGPVGAHFHPFFPAWPPVAERSTWSARRGGLA